MIKKLDHVVITTAHVDVCLRFYEKLGFTSKVSEGRCELFAGDFKINVHTLGSELSPHAQNVQSGSADFCFEIEGAAQNFKQMLEEKGVEIEQGVVARTGVRGKMSSVYVRDPDGNLLEFSSYEK